ncbi:hypothetical protein KI387_001468, partial [Taxus chinensis]
SHIQNITDMSRYLHLPFQRFLLEDPFRMQEDEKYNKESNSCNKTNDGLGY